MDDAQKIVVITEGSFSQIIFGCRKLGLKIDSPMGLNYLSHEKLTQDFKNATRAIIESLRIKDEISK